MPSLSDHYSLPRTWVNSGARLGCTDELSYAHARQVQRTARVHRTEGHARRVVSAPRASPAPELLDLSYPSSIIGVHQEFQLDDQRANRTVVKRKGDKGAVTVRQDSNHGPGAHAFVVLGEFLEADGWHPQQMGEKTFYRVGFSGQSAQVNGFAQVRTDLEQLVFYVMAPVKAPEETRQAVAEYITRANYGLRIGNFEMDFSDGEVRYKGSLDFEDVGLSPELIRHAIYPAVQTMDRYLPGLMRVIYGDASPEETINEIEQ